MSFPLPELRCSPPVVGIGYTPSVAHLGVLREVRDVIDYVVLQPDVFSRERTQGGRTSLVLQADLLQAMLDGVGSLPVVVHGLGLSIGTAAGFDPNYVELLDAFAARCRFLWHSEHLGFLQHVRADGARANVGVPLPLPLTREVVELIAPRAAWLQRRYGTRFLLENTVHYLPDLPADPGWDEPRLLNELSAASGCGLLLDLYNLWCNAKNLGGELDDLLSRIDRHAVVEVHVAGGPELAGYQLDVHTDLVPPPVLSALRTLLRDAPSLRGVTYELLDEGHELLTGEQIRAQLLRLRELVPAARCAA